MGSSRKSLLFPIALVASAFLLLASVRHLGQSVWGRGGKPRYIFVDLGANRADSLEAFLRHPDAKFKRDFPRPSWATYEQAGMYIACRPVLCIITSEEASVLMVHEVHPYLI